MTFRGGSFLNARLVTGLLASLAAAALVLLSPVPAHATTIIDPPTVKPSTAFCVIGVPFQLALSEDAGSAPAVAYQYWINSEPPRRVKAHAGAATITITPRGRRIRTEIVAVAADGTTSPASINDFRAIGASPAADKDVNGDGRPDLVVAGGGSTGLPSGIWQVLGAGEKGRLKVPATDIGVNGDDWSPTPSTWDGARPVLGDFAADNLQDVLMYFPSGQRTGLAEVYNGSGDGSELSVTDATLVANYPAFADLNGNNAPEVVDVYDAQNRGAAGPGVDDVLGIAGDSTHGYGLNYFPAIILPGFFGGPLSIPTPSPNGTPWNQWRLASAKSNSGTAIYLWNSSTGDLYLWNKFTVTDNGDGTASPSFTQYKVASRWNRGVDVSALEAADFSGDGVPDLWAVIGTAVHPYTVTELSTRHLADVVAGPVQSLT